MDELNMDSLDTSGLDTGSDDLYKGIDLYSDSKFKPDTSSMGELPPLASIDDLPELPDLPDMPELPDISDLPELPPVGRAASAAAVSVGDALSSLGSPDISAAASDELPELPKLSEMSDDFGTAGTDVSSVLSDMEGNAVDSVPDMKPITNAAAADDMMTPLDRIPSPQETPGPPQQYRRYSGADYDPNNVSTYRQTQTEQSGYQPTGQSANNSTGQYQSSLDKLYEARFEQDYEKAEKGKKKAGLVGLIGMIWYGINAATLLFSGAGIFGILALVVDAAMIYLLFMFRKGSNKAREILGWLASFSCIRGLLGFFSDIVFGGVLATYGGFGAALGIFNVLYGLANVVFSGYLAWIFFADEDVAEFCKSMRDGSLGRDADDALTNLMFFRRR